MKATDFREWLEKISQLNRRQKEQAKHYLSEAKPQAVVVKYLEDSFELSCPVCQADRPHRWGHQAGCNVFAVAYASTHLRLFRELLWPVCGIRSNG
mgnify:CR=1 FL=1